LDWKFFDCYGATSGELFWVIGTLLEEAVWVVQEQIPGITKWE